MDCPGQACSNAFKKRVIALAWAVEPLAFRVCLPPQATFADGVTVVALPPVALLLLPHADNMTAPVAKKLTAMPNRLSFNSIPSSGTDAMITAGVAATRQTAVFPAVKRHSNLRQLCPPSLDIAGFTTASCRRRRTHR